MSSFRLRYDAYIKGVLGSVGQGTAVSESGRRRRWDQLGAVGAPAESSLVWFRHAHSHNAGTE